MTCNKFSLLNDIIILWGKRITHKFTQSWLCWTFELQFCFLVPYLCSEQMCSGFSQPFFPLPLLGAAFSLKLWNTQTIHDLKIKTWSLQDLHHPSLKLFHAIQQLSWPKTPPEILQIWRAAEYHKGRWLVSHIRKSSEQLPCRASATVLFIPLLLSQSPVVSALHCCEYKLFPSYSLSALHWHLPPLFLPIPSITGFSKQQQLVLSPSSLDPPLTFPVHILPNSWLQLLLKYFPSTVYVWCKTNLVIKGFNDNTFFFYLKSQLYIGRFL